MKNRIAKYLKGDRVIWMVCLLLGLISVLAVYSSISSLAYKYTEGNTVYYLFKHGIMLGTGFLIMYFVHRVQYRYFSRLSQIAIYFAALLLLLTLVLGVNLNDASRWIRIPIINQNFQTSDFAKIALIAYVARMLTLRREHFHSFKEGLLPILIPIAVICGLILPANFSTAAMLFMVCVTLLFVGGIPIKHLLGMFGIAVAGFAMLLLLSFTFPDLLPRVETWKTRLTSFESGDSEANYQVEHAMMAIQAGGIIPGGPAVATLEITCPTPIPI